MLSFQAEISTVFLGMSLAWDGGYRRVEVETDSDLVFDLLTSFEQDSNIHNPLILESRHVMQRDWEIQKSKVFCEANMAKDGFANWIFHQA